MNVKDHAPASVGELSQQSETVFNPPDQNTEREAGCCVPSCCASSFSCHDGYLVTDNVILNLNKIIAINKFWRPNSACYQVVSQGNLILCLTTEEFTEVKQAMLQMARKEGE